MDSGEFHRMCHDMNSIQSDRVDIISNGKRFTMRARGEYANLTINMKEQQHAQITGENSDVCNTYSLKFLLCFTKAAKLSNKVSIRIVEDFPLVLEYIVENLGTLVFYLIPIESTSTATAEIGGPVVHDDDNDETTGIEIEETPKKRGRRPRKIEAPTCTVSAPVVTIQKRRKYDVE